MAQIANDTRFWDRAARKYAAGPIADMAGYERTLERTRHYLGGSDTVLEFGCGTGTTALRLAPHVGRIVATDISSEMIAIARGKAEAAACGNVAFEVATPAAISEPDATFDVALGFNVLHLITAREAALAGVHRLLKPGGIFISNPDAAPRQGALSQLSQHGRARTRDRGRGVRDDRARAPRLARPGCPAVPRGTEALTPRGTKAGRNPAAFTSAEFERLPQRDHPQRLTSMSFRCRL